MRLAWSGSRFRAIAAALVVGGAGFAAGARALWMSGSESELRSALSVSEEELEAEESLSRCRLYSALDHGLEPDWPRAEIACSRVLDLQPINEEANRLLKRIKDEQAAFDAFTRAEALQPLDELSALELLTQIPESSAYFRRARSQALEIKARATPRLEEDCARLLRSRANHAAVLTCEKLMALTCQDASWRARNAVEDNPGSRPGGAPDRLYRQFVVARRAVLPGSVPWRCPQVKLLEEGQEPPERGVIVREALLDRFSDRRIGQAIFSYWEGNLPAALAGLRACLHPKSPDHSTARQLRNRISMMMQLLKSGHSALQARDPERAATPFRAALEHDRHILGSAPVPPSSVARTIRREMSSHSYHRGKYWADRADTHRACRIWKLGYSFSRADLALLQAVKHCSERGQKLLAAARHCGEIAGAADLFAEGDGMLDKLKAKHDELGCR